MEVLAPVDFVQLGLKRNRAWPWPEDSWGLESMYGRDGWCHSCGIPLHEQTGPLTLQATGQSPVHGGWVPNWRFDVICLEATLAARLLNEYRFETRPIAWRRTVSGQALQIVIPVVEPAWFDPDARRVATTSRYGADGQTSAECGVWRWLLLPPELLPQVRWSPGWDEHDVVASPEWFGAGARSFREILVRRELAQAIASASPKDFKVIELAQLAAPSQ